MAADDLHAEHPLGRRAQHRRRDHHGDDRGQRRTASDLSDAPRAQCTTAAKISTGPAIAQPRMSRTCGGQAGVAGERVQREQAGRLREPEQREARERSASS